jgi:hypothetical protein
VFAAAQISAGRGQKIRSRDCGSYSNIRVVSPESGGVAEARPLQHVDWYADQGSVGLTIKGEDQNLQADVLEHQLAGHFIADKEGRSFPLVFKQRTWGRQISIEEINKHVGFGDDVVGQADRAAHKGYILAELIRLTKNTLDTFADIKRANERGVAQESAAG